MNSQAFQTVTQIPDHFAPGNLIWKPDSSGVVGNNEFVFTVDPNPFSLI